MTPSRLSPERRKEVQDWLHDAKMYQENVRVAALFEKYAWDQPKPFLSDNELKAFNALQNAFEQVEKPLSMYQELWDKHNRIIGSEAIACTLFLLLFLLLLRSARVGREALD